MSGDSKESITVIDGSVMEGGGQILRMAIAFSALFRKPVRIINIRAGRSNPGLRPQHLTGVQLVKDICNGRLENAFVGSTEITFFPGPIRGGDFKASTGTAGMRYLRRSGNGQRMVVSLILEGGKLAPLMHADVLV